MSAPVITAPLPLVVVAPVLLCQYCGAVPAEVFDIDGRWCSPDHRYRDRASEPAWWEKSAKTDPPVWMRTAVNS